MQCMIMLRCKFEFEIMLWHEMGHLYISGHKPLPPLCIHSQHTGPLYTWNQFLFAVDAAK